MRSARTAQERTQPGQQFLEGKGLGEVVVGAGLAQRLDDGAPVAARQAPVHDERVVAARERLFEPGLTVGRRGR